MEWDSICWYCKHVIASSGFDVRCDRCRRVFHADCRTKGRKKLTDIFPLVLTIVKPKSLCPVCQHLDYAKNIVYDQSMMSDLNRAIENVLVKYQPEESVSDITNYYWHPVSTVAFPKYAEFVIHPRCLLDCFNKAKNLEYSSAAEFECDIRQIYHNSCVFNGIETIISRIAKDLVDTVVVECSKIRFCNRCYYYDAENCEALPSVKTEFLKPCQRPHGITFAPTETPSEGGEEPVTYAPAKIMNYYIKNGNIHRIDVCFFGTRTSSSFLLSDCFTYSSNTVDVPAKFKLLLPPKAMEEVNKYINGVRILHKDNIARLEQYEKRAVGPLTPKHVYMLDFCTEWEWAQTYEDSHEDRKRINVSETQYSHFFKDESETTTKGGRRSLPTHQSSASSDTSSSHYQSMTNKKFEIAQARTSIDSKISKPGTSSSGKQASNLSSFERNVATDLKTKINAAKAQFGKIKSAETTPSSSKSSSSSSSAKKIVIKVSPKQQVVKKEEPKVERDSDNETDPQRMFNTTMMVKEKFRKELATFEVKQQEFKNRRERFDLFYTAPEEIQPNSVTTPEYHSTKNKEYNNMEAMINELAQMLDSAPDAPKHYTKKLQALRECLELNRKSNRVLLKESLRGNKTQEILDRVNEQRATIKSDGDMFHICDQCGRKASQIHPMFGAVHTFCSDECTTSFRSIQSKKIKN